MSGINITWYPCEGDMMQGFFDELCDMFGLEQTDFWVTYHGRKCEPRTLAYSLPHAAWLSINFRGYGSGKRAKSTTGKTIDKEDMIESIKNDLHAKMHFLSTINDQEIKTVCDHINAFTKGVDAYPKSSFTRAMSLIDTPTLEKISQALRCSGNFDYKTNVMAKTFYASDISVMTKKECAIKTVKEMGKGAFDLSVKIMIFHSSSTRLKAI